MTVESMNRARPRGAAWLCDALLLPALLAFGLAALALLTLPMGPAGAQSASTSCERTPAHGACADFGREECGRYMYPANGCRCDGTGTNYSSFVPCYWNERDQLCLADLRQRPWQGVCPLRIEPLPTGPIVFMDVSEVCKKLTPPTPCYLQDRGQAWNTIHTLAVFGGATRFLIPAADKTQVGVLGRMIQDYNRDFRFFTQERWTFGASIDPATGDFNCQTFINNKYRETLTGYANDAAINRAFAGFHFPDEPDFTQADNLKAFKACLYAAPELRLKEVFLNLFPLYASEATIMGRGGDQPVSILDYNRYVSEMAKKVQPTYLAIDFYPFWAEGFPKFASPLDRDIKFATNLHTLSAHAYANGTRPVAYLQNAQSPGTAQKPLGFPLKRASGTDLKWMASWSFAFGITELASWVSHDAEVKDPPRPNVYYWGLMDKQNRARPLASVDQKALGDFIRHIQPAFIPYLFRRGAAPFIGINLPANSIVHSIGGDSGQVLLGEYERRGTQQALLFFARRGVNGTATNRVTLRRWHKIEKLDVATGNWDLDSAGANAITLGISDEPGVLYRLTGDPRQAWRY